MQVENKDGHYKQDKDDDKNIYVSIGILLYSIHIQFLFTTLICSSSLIHSLSNLKSNNYNKNDTRRKTTTPIQYSTHTRTLAMMMMTTTATLTISITIMMTTTSTTDGLGRQQQ